MLDVDLQWLDSGWVLLAGVIFGHGSAGMEGQRCHVTYISSVDFFDIIFRYLRIRKYVVRSTLYAVECDMGLCNPNNLIRRLLVELPIHHQPSMLRSEETTRNSLGYRQWCLNSTFSTVSIICCTYMSVCDVRAFHFPTIFLIVIATATPSR